MHMYSVVALCREVQRFLTFTDAQFFLDIFISRKLTEFSEFD